MITYKCPKCNGKPYSNSTKIYNGITFTNCICDFCYGKSELDFIENLFGVDISYSYNEIKNLNFRVYPNSI